MGLLAIGVAAAVAFQITRAPPPRGHPGAPAPRRYACPMHPDIGADGPGSCPICGMALVAAPTGEGAAAVDLDPSRVAVARVRTFAREVRAPAWVAPDGRVLALLYADEIAGLAADEPARFTPSAAGAPPVAVRRTRDPPRAWDEASLHLTFHADFHTDFPASRLRPGDTGWLLLAARPRAQLVIPAGAVLPSPAGPYVLLAGADGRDFQRRRVRIGSVVYDQAAVLDGLRAGDRVALRSAFFVDAAQRTTRAAAPELAR